MSRWIKEIIVRYDDKHNFIYGNTLGEVVGELVRCKECKHRASGRMGKMCVGRHPDDFCSYGERKESE